MADSSQFSVIIPVYKGEAYLAETLESVLAQTLQPREILVIDDGSPDSSGAIARNFGTWIRVLRRQNCGVSATRNFGAMVAQGTWLAFLDQDDVWEPHFLETHAARIQAAPEIDLWYSGRRHLQQQEGTHTFLPGPPVGVPAAEQLRQVLVERCPFNPSAVTLRRSTFLASGGFNGAFNSVEDWEFWLRLHLTGASFARCEEPLLQYRIHPGGNTNNALLVLDRSLALIRQNVLPRMSPLRRTTRGRRIVSRLEAEAAIVLRETLRDGDLQWMLRSLATHPFHGLRRYKIAAHMLLQHAREASRTPIPRHSFMR